MVRPSTLRGLLEACACVQLGLLASGVSAFAPAMPGLGALAHSPAYRTVARRPGRGCRGVHLRGSAADWQEATDAASGKVYFWNVATGETAWSKPADADGAETPGLPVQFTQGTKARVQYKQVLGDALAALNAARAAGKRRLQIEFPLNDEDQGKTLVKRFELMATWAEELAAGIGLPRMQRVGEDIQIRDNITPGGGGEYLTNEGVYGYRLSSADDTQQVLLVMVAGVDLERLNDLEVLVGGSTDVGRQLPGGMEVEVASTGVLSSLDTVGYVRDMAVNADATIVLINSGLDQVIAGGSGLFGLGGASKFLRSFEPCYYIKRASTGFLTFDFARGDGWKTWGVPRDATALEFRVVDQRDQRPAFWEVEQKIKTVCRA